MPNDQVTNEVHRLTLKYHQEIDGETKCNGEDCKRFNELFVFALGCAINAVELVTGLRAENAVKR